MEYSSECDMSMCGIIHSDSSHHSDATDHSSSMLSMLVLICCDSVIVMALFAVTK